MANDYLGSQIVETLKDEQVDMESMVFVNKSGVTTGFSYIILEESNKQRTIIHNPCEDLLETSEVPMWESVLEDVKLLLVDGKHSLVSHKVSFVSFVFTLVAQSLVSCTDLEK